jgi:hypothetical protein
VRCELEFQVAGGLRAHIDAMLQASPQIATAAIWERLADRHGTTVAYPTLRTYVTSRRARIRADS